MAVTAIVAVLVLWTNSDAFQGLVRERLATQVRNMVGGRVEIGAFHWKLFNLEVDAEQIVIHGDEPAGEAPYASIARLDAKFSVLGLMSPRVLLRDLEIEEPRIHLIVYRDGQTNQPQPAKVVAQNRSGLDTLFDLQAGHVAVSGGSLDIDDRAASLDFQNRYEPLDFRGDDVAVTMRYATASGATPERYLLEASAHDVNLARGGKLAGKIPAVHGVVRASAELTRDAFLLRSLQLTAHTKGTPDRTLEITGQWRHFAEPTWSARVKGSLDMRLLDPVLGYPFAPEGIAHLDLTCAGEGAQFGIDGTVHAEKASYIGTGVVARDIDLTARVHADPQHLRVTQVVARLQPGGELSGEVLLDHWLPPTPGQAEMHAAAVENKPASSLRQRLLNRLHRKAAPPAKPSAPVAPHSVLVKSPVVSIPVDGTVKAQLSNVSLDTLMAIVGQGPFERLGIATLLNGPADAKWNKGDVNTLGVNANLTLSPEGNAPAGEAPGSGAVDATYRQRDGSVDVRTLAVNLPSSHIEAHGRLGAYPITSASTLNVSFQSQNLGEFDTVLRDLGLKRNGRAGAAALPVSMKGQGQFQGTWTGSLQSPILAGTMHATDVALELPQPDQNGNPRYLHWDSVEASGSYDAEQIAIAHAHLQRGTGQIDVSGTLTAALPSAGRGHRIPRSAELPAFDLNSLLHVQARATQVSSKDLLSITGLDLPVSGLLSTQLDVSGPMHAPTGTGWAQLDNAVVYGEPITSVRAQGTASASAVQLTSFTARAPAGTITGSGAYDMTSKRLELNARSAAIDLGRIDKFKNNDVRGKLNFVLAAAGTREHPQLQAQGSVTGLGVQGQTLGALQFQTHSNGQELIYDAGTRLDSAELKLHGDTDITGDLATQARLEFSHFDVGRLLQLAHVEGIKAQSSLAGVATVAGPLRKVDALRGDLHLASMAVTVSGVHLQSEGAVHAVLAGGQVQLDPVHVTGDNTDLRAQGTVGLTGERRLNVAAGGTVNLKLMETLDPDVTAAGTTHFKVEARGPLNDPSLSGTIDFQDGSIAMEDLPNGLSQINGSLRFNQNRLEVVSLSAMTGGGKLSLGGYLAYQRGLFADISVTGNSIRIRYPEGVSSLADAKLRLQGTPASFLLSGGVLITRFSVSPDLDFAALAAKATNMQTVAPPNTPSNHVRLDVRIQSSPQLSFQNAYAKLAGDVDLRLRGTLASPSLLGRVSITQGDAVIAGTHYELQRGDITFNNPVRIQPTIDLNATARVEDYDITLGLHGTPDKLSVTYRSDPPLPETDVVALLALGRTQSEQGLYTEQQQQSIGLSPSTDLLLGGALNATVTSRVQKLFGAGSVKVDPSYLGALGNSTTRITVEEQVGKNLTLTYATNVDTSAQQLLQAEIAINRHVALLVTRDESGVFSMVIKATRRYR